MAVTTAERDTAAAIRAAALVSGAMIAFQVGSRATRDALFLSTYDVTSLPRMIMVASLAAIAAVVAASRPMARFGPGRVVPALFAASAGLMLLEWALVAPAPRVAAVVVFIHFNALGALLVSGFWSVINERFDPRTAKRAVGHIAAAGTAGGLAGGLLAERAAALLSVAAMLPMLAALHLLCAGLVLRVRAAGSRERPAASAARETWTTGLRAIGAAPYLRTLVAVVLLATLAEGLIDYVFKAQARAAYGRGPELLRLFALFYTGVSLLSVVVQTGLSRPALERFGLARTVGMLPWMTAIGGAGAIAVPGLASAMFARGAGAVVRNSLYRSGYELLFTPLAPPVKRAAKPLVDVGVLRIGDAIAAGLVQAALFALPGSSSWTAMLVLAVAFAAAGIAITFTVHAGYVATLEKSLLSHAVRLELDDVEDETTRTTLMHTLGAVPRVEVPATHAEGTPPLVPPSGTPLPPDPVLGRIHALRSSDPRRVRAALAKAPLDAAHVPHAIALLAWDEVAADALAALKAAAPHHTGQLVDALLDQDEDFTVRRRLPAALAQVRSRRAVEGLLEGLADRRFEVRFRCGRALARLAAADPALAVEAGRVHAAVLREVAVDRQVWESQRLLDRADEDDREAGFVDEVLRDRASRSLEHVFTVLSLVLPRQALRVAFRGLHTDDPQLRGTALEYLETALPAPVHAKLWPFLDDHPRRAAAPARPREEVVAELLRSNESIALNLAALRRKQPSP